MSDSAACEYAQTSHMALGLQCQAFTPAQLVTLHGRIPRDHVMAGIIIDDFILLEKVARDAFQALLSAERRARMHAMYKQVGLDAHPTKGFAGEDKASFWVLTLMVSRVQIEGILCVRFRCAGPRPRLQLWEFAASICLKLSLEVLCRCLATGVACWLCLMVFIPCRVLGSSVTS